MVERQQRPNPEHDPRSRLAARRHLLGVEKQRHTSHHDHARDQLDRAVGGRIAPLEHFDTGVTAGRELGQVTKELAMIQAMRTAGIDVGTINTVLDVLDQHAIEERPGEPK